MNANDKSDIKSQANAWWVRVDSGTMTANEQARLDTWLNANPLHRDAFDQVNHLWQELDGLKERLAATLPTPAIKERTRNNFDIQRPLPQGEGWGEGIKCSRYSVYVPKPRRPYHWQWGMGALAACFLLLLLCNPMTLWLRADITTGISEMRSEVLADGSTVLLNSESALSVAITETSRQLTLLQGEALFTVRPDPTRPFQVHAGNGIITALGTAFNVHHDKTITGVTVKEHSVSVQLDSGSANPSAPVIVGNGQQVSYNKALGLSTINSVDTHITSAWERGKLIFQDKPLGEVIAELNHYHRGYFLISDPQITQRRVNGVFSTDKPIAALNAIEQSLHLHSNRISHYLVLLHR